MVDVDPQVFYDASKACYELADDLAGARGVLVMALANKDTGGMAGSDDASAPWAVNYDQRATDTVALAQQIGAALSHVAGLLQWGGYNHAYANWKADTAANKGDAPKEPPQLIDVGNDVAEMVPPSAHDNGTGVITTIANLVSKIGVKVPNGDTDKLGDAAAAWDAYVKDKRVSGAVDRLKGLDEKFAAMSSPEIGDIEIHFRALQSGVNDLTTGASGIAQLCKDYKSALDDLRSEICKSVAEFVALIAGTQIVAAAVTFFTAGAAAAADAGATEAEVESAAATVTRLVKDSRLVRLVLPKGAKEVEDLTRAETDMRKLGGLRPYKAEETEGAGLGNTSSLPSSFSRSDLQQVEQHLGKLDHFDANDAMIERIGEAIDQGKPLTESQQNFMNHELTEAKLMDKGMPYEDAHELALETHPPGQNYDPDVIDKYPEFGPWWRKMNGLPPR
ncbi:hypothetical protein [Nocardia sp. NBC_00511]|uniref:hypothetical protein n=1 Tax=Nocardia sp. NBC_00511 TaxID=2903591 RepID=UPI0030E4DA74